MGTREEVELNCRHRIGPREGRNYKKIPTRLLLRNLIYQMKLKNSRITLLIGFVMLIGGVMTSSSSRKLCGISIVRHYISIGGIVCFIHGLFAFSYYISAKVVEKEEKKLKGSIMTLHGPVINPLGPVDHISPSAPI